MLGWILGLTLLGLPLLEVWLILLTEVSLTATLVWSVLTAAVGWRFARREDLSLWSELEADVVNGRLPTIEGVDTMLLVLGGWGLVVPGFLTDAAGALLLIPPLRRALTDGVRQAIRLYQS